MKFQIFASNALNKYLKADLPRLPHEPNRQARVNTLISDNDSFNWRMQIIDNSYKSRKKTSLFVKRIAALRFLYLLV